MRQSRRRFGAVLSHPQRLPRRRGPVGVSRAAVLTENSRARRVRQRLLRRRRHLWWDWRAALLGAALERRSQPCWLPIAARQSVGRAAHAVAVQVAATARQVGRALCGKTARRRAFPVAVAGSGEVQAATAAVGDGATAVAAVAAVIAAGRHGQVAAGRRLLAGARRLLRRERRHGAPPSLAFGVSPPRGAPAETPPPTKLLRHRCRCCCSASSQMNDAAGTTTPPHSPRQPSLGGGRPTHADLRLVARTGGRRCFAATGLQSWGRGLLRGALLLDAEPLCCVRAVPSCHVDGAPLPEPVGARAAQGRTPAASPPRRGDLRGGVRCAVVTPAARGRW